MTVKGWTMFLFACPLCAWAQNPSPSGTARVIVTVGHFDIHDTRVPLPTDLILTSKGEALAITSLTPVRGDRAGIELYLVVDNCSNCEVGSKFDELRSFIQAQPSTTTMGVAYIQDGRLKVAQPLTSDRARVIGALNPPSGSQPASPFNALTELIGSWNPTVARHVVLMISNGIDPQTDSAIDPPAEAAIEAAQRAGVIVYAIYHPSANWDVAGYSEAHSGQVQLAHVAYETGGQAYFLGINPLGTLEPYFADIADHLANQYLLEFPVGPSVASGLQPISVRSKVEDFDVDAPSKIWIPEQSPDR
jgi:hypothetical protein